MIAEVVCIGTELLLGQVLNSDAQYLAGQLAALGVTLRHQTTVGDNQARVQEALALALGRADVVITTGGLGPTQDDLSKEAVAALFGLPMAEDAASLAAMRAYFAGVHRHMADNNRRQASFPQGAVILPNARGTAPGCIVEKDGKCVIQLPGPPRELTHMFETSVVPYLRRRGAGSITSRYVRIFGMGESDVETRVRDLIDAQGDVTIAPYCSTGEVQLRLTASAENPQAALDRIAPVEAAIRQRLGDVVYAVSDSPQDSLAHHTVAALAAAGLRCAVAESCTGGLVAAALVSVPGASEVFLEGYVTYSNAAKARCLGVSPDTLAVHGAVSEQTACEMAEGARLASGADVAVATTGVAGPGGGTPEKPVGLVYIALAGPGGIQAQRLTLHGERGRIRDTAALYALDMLRRACGQHPQPSPVKG
ncbi:MAG: competence/damage-inducible protein A [Oscillospiraceae bacterium]|nr:competence/damage-inducible protein A [Oscillospiraceae bacterium]